jgi:hypothetical protein
VGDITSSKPGGAPKPSKETGLLAGHERIARSLKNPSRDNGLTTGASMKVFRIINGEVPTHGEGASAPDKDGDRLLISSPRLFGGGVMLPAEVLRD